jgi:Endopolygalacturonase
MKRKIIFLALAAFLHTGIRVKAVSNPWSQMKALEKSIQHTSFPKNEFNILAEGAVQNDSIHLSTKAINNAIDKCSQSGGGKVVIPKGIFYTGGIRMKSNVNLHLAEGATLRFSTNPNDYLPVVLTRWEGLDCYNIQPLIYACNQTNIAITGNGVIDGQGSNDAWWPLMGKERYGWKAGMKSQKTAREELERKSQQELPVEERVYKAEDGLRPQMINPYKCNRVLIEGVTLINAPFWVIHPLMCENLVVRDVKIKNHGPNGDGCDPESCNKVLIEKCLFETGDDCIAIKSGRNHDGRKWNIPSQNIIIRDCEMKDGHGAVVIGSEISGGFKNLYVENCKMDSHNLDRVLRIKSNICRGGTIENVFMRNVTIGECKEAVVKVELNYFINTEKCTNTYIPIVRNVHLENVTSRKSDYGVNIDGLKQSDSVYGFTLKNCKFDGVKFGNKIIGAKDFKFTKYYINGTECPEL